MKYAIGPLAGGILAGVFGTAAAANDLPLAEPAEFIRICDSYGNGFFYIPGTDTCLRVSGLVRVDLKVEDDSFNRASNDLQSDIRGRLQLDARTETDRGTLRSYLEFEHLRTTYIGVYSDGGGGAISTTQGPVLFEGVTSIRQAFIEFAGITAGHLYRSLYDFAPYKHMSDLFSDERVNTLAYTITPEDGVQLTLGIEDKYFRANPNDGTFDTELDQVWPNGIAVLHLKKGWGEARLAAAVQDNEGDRDVGPAGDEIGWASMASVVVNFPTEIAGSRVWAQAGYSEGALSYIGSEDFRVNFVSTNLSGAMVRDQRDDGTGSLVNTEAWSAGTGVKWYWTKNLHSNLSAIYTDVDPGGGFAAFDYLFAEANIFWNPVTNLELGIGVHRGEASINSSGAAAPETSDHWAAVGRIGRSF